MTHPDGRSLDNPTAQELNEDHRRSREAYRALADNTPDSIDRIDRQFRHLHINAVGAALVGKTPAEVIGKTNRELGVPDPVASIWEERIRTVFETSERLDVEDAFPAADGMRFFERRCVPERSPDGRVQTVLTVSRDMTRRKRAEEALRESRATLAAALASMTDAVFISDAAGHFIDFNEAFASFHRFPGKAECARSLSDYPAILDVFMPNGDQAPLDMWAVPRALRGETATNEEYTLRRKDTKLTENPCPPTPSNRFASSPLKPFI